MTETAEQRTKRIFTNYLKDYEWPLQVSVFYRDYVESLESVEDSKVFRREIARAYGSQAFVWRLCLVRTSTDHLTNTNTPFRSIMVPYHTFFTTKNVSTEEFGDCVERTIPKDLYIKKKRRTYSSNLEYAETVSRSRAHNLHKFFGAEINVKINRFSFFNKRHLRPVWKHGVDRPISEYLGDYYDRVLDLADYQKKVRRDAKLKLSSNSVK